MLAYSQAAFYGHKPTCIADEMPADLSLAMTYLYRLIATVGTGFFLFILWMIYLANTGGSSLFFAFIRGIPYGDKLSHFALFGTLTFVAIVGSQFRTLYLGKLRIYWGALAVVIFVVAEEVSQAFIPTRTFDLVDLAADFVGMALAIALSYALNKLLHSNLTAPHILQPQPAGAAT